MLPVSRCARSASTPAEATLASAPGIMPLMIACFQPFIAIPPFRYTCVQTDAIQDSEKSNQAARKRRGPVMEYLLVKWLHILSSTFLFGTGIGSAWYLLFAVISRNVAAIAVVTRIVVIADWLFTGTTMIAQPLTGFYLIHLAGYPLHSRWIMWSIALFVLAALCWLPVVWLQMRLRDL